MADEIDEFAASLLEQAKRFLEKGTEAHPGHGRDAYLNAAMMLGFASLEAHVNAVADEFSGQQEITIHDKSVLQEKEARLIHGQWEMTKADKFYRLEERIQFIHARFSRAPLDRTVAWWSDLSKATRLRNQLTHPKSLPNIAVVDVERALHAVLDAINALYLAVYGRGFPAYSRGLQSKLSF